MATTKKLTVRLAVRTPDVHKALQDILQGVNRFSFENDPNATRVDVLVLEIGSDPATELETIRSLLKEGAVGTLFVTSAETTPEILLPALRTGAKEFFQQPIISSEVLNAFAQIQDQPGEIAISETSSVKGKIFSVLGAKGGVGTTTFAVNLATSLQDAAKDSMVALIDLNRLVGEVPLFLDLETDLNWEEIGKNIHRLDASFLKSAMVQHSSGIYVMPAPVWLESGQNLPQDYLIQILSVMQNFFSYIVIDTGMYLVEESFRILEMSESVFLISTLNLPCMINVKRIRESLQTQARINSQQIRVIANRYERKTQISLTEAEKIIGVPIETTIPNDYGLTMKAINNGKVLEKIDKNAAIVKAFISLAASLVDKPETKKSRWRLFK